MGKAFERPTPVDHVAMIESHCHVCTLRDLDLLTCNMGANITTRCSYLGQHDVTNAPPGFSIKVIGLYSNPHPLHGSSDKLRKIHSFSWLAKSGRAVASYNRHGNRQRVSPALATKFRRVMLALQSSDAASHFHSQ